MSGIARVTLKDIADRLNVSRTTVSLALKDSHRISEAQRKKIQTAAKEMGYAPDPFLSGLVAYRRKNTLLHYQGTLAWIRHWHVPESLLKSEYYRELWRGACQTAKNYGYVIEEFCWDKSFSAKRYEQILLARGIHGILIPPHRHVPNWDNFDWSKFSVIRFGMSVPLPDTNLVTPDGFRAVAMAIHRIHQYGYKRIGFIVGEFDRMLGGNFCGGFLSAQSYLQLTPAIPPLVTSADSYCLNPNRENQVLKRWLKQHKPDAILTTEGQLTEQLRQIDYRVPKDVAVASVSVHDTEIDTGIDQHVETVGRIGVEMLVKQINVNERGEPSDPCRILVESHWQDGKSLPSRRRV